jgi:hypothetical protein
MTSANRIHHLLYRGPKVITDPGDGGIITASADLQICEMVSTTTETRTLSNPTKAGIRLVLRMLTDGGDIVVGAANGFNTALALHATFADAGDMLSLISVTTVANTTYRWQTLDGITGPQIATVTLTKTATATDTGTLTKTDTLTKTITATDTGTLTKTNTNTLTKTLTKTDTKTSTNAGSKTGTTTKTDTATDTLTLTKTDTISASKTKTATDTLTKTDTTSPSKTSTSTDTNTATATATS